MALRTDIDINKIYGLYQLGIGTVDIAKRLNIPPSTVYNHLRYSGLPMRTRSEANLKYKIDSNMFENPQENWLYYYMGWIWSDGALIGNTIKLQLAIKDIDVLEYLNQKIFNGKKPIYITEGKDIEIMGRESTAQASGILNVVNKKIANDLQKFGLTERKSKTIGYPKIDRKFDAHFLLGCFDGDGCCCSSKYKTKYNKTATLRKVEIIGSEKFCNECRDILKYHGMEFQVNTRSTVYSVWTSKYSEIEKFYNFLYKDYEFCLERKKRKIQNIIDIKKRIDLWQSIGKKGIYYDNDRRLWRFIFNGELIGFFKTFEEVIDLKIKMISEL